MGLCGLAFMPYGMNTRLRLRAQEAEVDSKINVQEIVADIIDFLEDKVNTDFKWINDTTSKALKKSIMNIKAQVYNAE